MEQNSKLTIIRSPAFIEEYDKYETYHKYEPIRNFMSNRKFVIKDTNLTYRVLQHWCSYGLLDDDRGDKNSWRSFTSADLVWIQILIELRAVGLSLDKLKQAYHSMFHNPTNNKKWKMLEFCIYQVFMNSAVFIIVCPSSGHLQILMDDDVPINMVNGNMLNHHYISLNLKNCMQKIGQHNNFMIDLNNAHVQSNQAYTNNPSVKDKCATNEIKKDKNQTIIVSVDDDQM